jgi:hypothetical protein
MSSDSDIPNDVISARVEKRAATIVPQRMRSVITMLTALARVFFIIFFGLRGNFSLVALMEIFIADCRE